MPRVARFCLPVLAMLFFATVAASAQTLTVMELLQSPRQFEDRRVSVSGYYYGDFESQILYADLAAAKRHDRSRSIWIDSQPPVESKLRRAHIIGVFFYARRFDPKRMSVYGAFGMWPSQLINCTIHLRREATPAPNKAMQRTAGSLGP